MNICPIYHPGRVQRDDFPVAWDSLQASGFPHLPVRALSLPLFSTCMLLQILSFIEQKLGYTISLRLLIWPAVVIYAIQIYTSARVLVAKPSTAAMGTALLTTIVLVTALLLVASILELLK